MGFPSMWHFDKCRLSCACVASFKLRNSKRGSFSSLTAIKYLNVCAGWSEPLLVAHTLLLEISFQSLFHLHGYWIQSILLPGIYYTVLNILVKFHRYRIFKKINYGGICHFT